MTRKAIIPKIYQLKISLNYVRPTIRRRFQVRGDIKLGKLHEIVQDIMGWQDCHLYCFNICGVEYADPDLNPELFESLFEAKVLIEGWRKEYSHVRPHSALGYRPPAPEAVAVPGTGSGYDAATVPLPT